MMKCKDCGSEMIKMIEPTRKGIPLQAFICPNVKTHRLTLPGSRIPIAAVYCEQKKESEKPEPPTVEPMITISKTELQKMIDEAIRKRGA